MSLDIDELTHCEHLDNTRLDSEAFTNALQSHEFTFKTPATSLQAPVSPPTTISTYTSLQSCRVVRARVVEVFTLLSILIVSSQKNMYIWPDLLFEANSTVPNCSYGSYIPLSHNLISDIPAQPDRGRTRSRLQGSHGSAGQYGINEESREIPDYEYGPTTSDWGDRAEGCSTVLREDVYPISCIM